MTAKELWRPAMASFIAGPAPPGTSRAPGVRVLGLVRIQTALGAAPHLEGRPDGVSPVTSASLRLRAAEG